MESVLQRRKIGRRTEALVKWFGYPSKFNSWIGASALVHSTIKTSRAYGDSSFEKRHKIRHHGTFVRYRVSQRGDSVSDSDQRLVHGHPDKHL